MPGKVFAPGLLDVLLGKTVSWSNSDVATHSVTADGDTFDSGHLRSGQEFSRTFTATGAFAYHCSIHRFMRGEVRVYAVVLRGPERPLLPGFATRLEGQARRTPQRWCSNASVVAGPSKCDALLLGRTAASPSSSAPPNRRSIASAPGKRSARS